jgi:hypothetical protein
VTKKQPDHKLILWCWVGLIVCALFHAINLIGWWIGLVSDRLNNAITNQLSWVALEITAAGMLITAYAKRDINT